MTTWFTQHCFVVAWQRRHHGSNLLPPVTHLHIFSPPAVAPTSHGRWNSSLGYQSVFIFYSLASLCSLLGSLGLVYSAEFKCFVGDRGMLIQLLFWYDMFWSFLGNLCWDFICGLIHTQCWFGVVYVSEEICWICWSGCGEWPLDLLIIVIFLVLNFFYFFYL